MKKKLSEKIVVDRQKFKKLEDKYESYRKRIYREFEKTLCDQCRELEILKQKLDAYKALPYDDLHDEIMEVEENIRDVLKDINHISEFLIGFNGYLLRMRKNYEVWLPPNNKPLFPELIDYGIRKSDEEEV